jgi:hypothetical protein
MAAIGLADHPERGTVSLIGFISSITPIDSNTPYNKCPNP